MEKIENFTLWPCFFAFCVLKYIVNDCIWIWIRYKGVIQLKEKKKSQRLFITDIAREGRGVSKTESELSPGLRRFFLCLKNNIGKLLSLNIMMVLGNFPFIFIIIALAGYTQKNYMLPLSDFYQNEKIIKIIDLQVVNTSYYDFSHFSLI